MKTTYGGEENYQKKISKTDDINGIEIRIEEGIIMKWN